MQAGFLCLLETAQGFALSHGGISQTKEFPLQPGFPLEHGKTCASSKIMAGCLSASSGYHPSI